ncbi:MAG: hypothetical protein Q8P12_03240 [bacterium]|nr:hypothetical protein [bacterium]
MVDIIPKAPKRYSLFMQVMFMLSVAAFVISAGGFGVLWYLERTASDRLKEVEAVLGAGKTEEEAQLENDVFAARLRLQDFSALVAQRKDFLPAFGFLETVVHPNVYFPAMSMDSLRQDLQLRGQATSFAVLDEQIAVFQAREEPSRISLTSLRLGEAGGVDFQIGVQFPLEFFQ